MNTTQVRKSVAALSHPLTIGMIVLLLFNDHFLRRLWPSWWTGKLGDAAWLFFAPMLVLLLLAVCVPRLSGRAERILPWLAYGLVGLVYTLGNTWAGFNAALVQAGQRLLGMPLQITLDPSDLLALPFLAASFWFWQRIECKLAVEAPRRALGTAAALLGALLTIANVSAPQYGVEALDVQDGKITACAAFQNYSSTDGGITWALDSVDYGDVCGEAWDGRLEADWQGEQRLYQHNAEANRIESSTDGGASWQEEYRIEPVSEAQAAYYLKYISGNVHFMQGPLDGVFDPVSGNLVFAMGLEGVLVRSADGAWQTAAVDRFSPIKMDSLDELLSLLWGELILAVFVWLLLFATLAVRLLPKWYVILPLVVGWLGWLITDLLFRPALYENYPIPLGMVLAAVGLFVVPMSAFGLYQFIRHAPKKLVVAMLISDSGFALFLTPYLLWAFDIVSSYSLAMVVSLVGAGLCLVLSLLLGGNTKGGV